MLLKAGRRRCNPIQNARQCLTANRPLRQDGDSLVVVNHKRVERLYAESRLQVKRRRRKKVPVSDRQPLGRPQAANQVWSRDFVFDRTAEGRVIKNLTVVDDATHEAVDP